MKLRAAILVGLGVAFAGCSDDSTVCGISPK
jgi:hypothetical protein